MLAAEAEVRNRRADEALALVEELRGRGYNEHLSWNFKRFDAGNIGQSIVVHSYIVAITREEFRSEDQMTPIEATNPEERGVRPGGPRIAPASG
jgi:hypothetical protein